VLHKLPATLECPARRSTDAPKLSQRRASARSYLSRLPLLGVVRLADRAANLAFSAQRPCIQRLTRSQ
jgi:hypothetical protein